MAYVVSNPTTLKRNCYDYTLNKYVSVSYVTDQITQLHNNDKIITYSRHDYYIINNDVIIMSGF